MRDPVPTTIHLKDYTPPAFLIRTVDLDVDLREEHAEVRARLALARNAAAVDRNAPLVLDGDELQLVSVAIDGRALARPRVHARCRAPDDRRRAGCASRSRRSCASTPRKNTKLMGLYASKDGFFTQCEAEGFRRITWFLDRPDVMARYTDDDPRATGRGTRCCCRTATSSPAGDDGGRPPLGEVGGPVPEALLPLRAGGGEARRARGHVRHALGQARAARDLRRAGQARPVRVRHAGPQEVACSGTRRCSASSSTSTAT